MEFQDLGLENWSSPVDAIRRLKNGMQDRRRNLSSTKVEE